MLVAKRGEGEASPAAQVKHHQIASGWQHTFIRSLGSGLPRGPVGSDLPPSQPLPPHLLDGVFCILMTPKQPSQLCWTQNIQLLLNLRPALTTLRELPRHSPICWRRTQSHSLLISPWPCLWPPDSPCGHKPSLRYCQVWLKSCRVTQTDWKSNTYDIFPKGPKAALMSSVVISGLRSPTKTWKWPEAREYLHG